MRSFVYILLFLTLSLLPLKSTYAQQYNFKYYSIENGLAQSQVFSLLQDKNGYLWIGTYGGGLNKFDGISFSLYTVMDGLQSNDVRAIFEDSQNNIWIGTSNGGLAKFNGKGFTKINSERISVFSINEDSNGQIWVGTEKDGVFILSGNKLISVKELSFIKSNTVHSILSNKSGNIILAVDNIGIVVFDGKSSRTFSIKGINITSIAKDENGLYWVGTEEGLYNFNGSNFESNPYYTFASDNITYVVADKNNTVWATTFGRGIIKITNGNPTRFTETEGLKGSYFNCVIIDNQGSICIGTDGDGICRYEGERFRYFNTQSGLPGNTIMSLYQDLFGNYWFGSYGKGVCKFDGTNYKNITQKDGLCDDIIYAIIGDRKGNIWFGSKRGGISKYDGKKFINYTEKEGLCSNEATSLAEDKDGNIWIGSRHNGLSCFDGKNFTNISVSEGLSSKNILTLYIDKSDNLWIGTQEGIINKLVLSTQKKDLKKSHLKIITYTTPKLHSCVYAIAEDNFGNMWFGSQENGIFSFDGRVFKNITTRDGITSDYIYSMLFDDKNNMWIGTLKGADRISFNNISNKPHIKNFGIKDGFIGIETNLHAILKDNDGKLLFGTVNGVMIYNPKADILNTSKPITNVTNILLFYQKVDWKKYSDSIDKSTGLPLDLKLPYNKNYLTFKFIGTDLTNAENVKYKWKLEGFDEDWTPFMTQNEANYSNLPSGEYTFLVKSFNNSGIGDEINCEFRFTIIPPFWQRWIFRISLILALALMVYGYFKRREWQLRRDKLRLERTVRERTEEIVKQKAEISRKNDELETINTELEKLSIVARETDNAIIIMDANGCIEWMNEGFLTMFGYTHNDIPRLKQLNIFEISSYEKIAEIMYLCYSTKQSVSYEASAITQKGLTIWSHTTLTPILDEEDKIIKLVSIDSDISKLIEAEENLKLEKTKSDNLLLNILPVKTAEELKNKGAATPKYYKSSTIAFTDFKGFTLLCEQISPHELIEELHTYFAKFDDIIEKYSIEKIKTVGDSYMFAGGLPAENTSHPIEVVLAALEIQRYMIKQNKEKERLFKPAWHLRVGIHTGEVITGVVGKKKFAYDVWGDTVNVASRMESAGIPESVNVSEETFNLIKEYFVCEYRGEIDVKHKDKISMYLVNSLKPEYSMPNNPNEPNQEFLKLIENMSQKK